MAIGNEIIIGDPRINSWQLELEAVVWPEFMRQDRVMNEYWPNLYTAFSPFQFAVFEEESLMGIANSIPVHWPKPFEDLPDEGLDWAMKKGNMDFQQKRKPNILVGIQILINPQYQNQGMSYTMLNIMKSVARKNGLSNVALPVRPTFKSRHPLTPMKEYIQWQNEDNLPFDPWIRVHAKAKGKIIKVCNRSMDISGTLKEWESWTNTKIHSSGDLIIKNALSPIQVNVAENRARYIEPNVWIVHQVTSKLK